MTTKPIVGVGSARASLVEFPEEVGASSTFDEAVYVLHAFDKTTRATSKRDLDTGRARYAPAIARRARHP